MSFCSNISDFLLEFGGTLGYITPTIYCLDFMEFQIMLHVFTGIYL